MQLPSHPLWEFSLRVYGDAAVAQACLMLQDQAGADVNVLLACCWAASVGADPLSEPELAAAVQALAAWQGAVVQPLRRLRRQWRQGCEGISERYVRGLRQALQEVELKAEQIEQLQLAAALRLANIRPRPQAEQARNAARNLLGYLALLQAPRAQAQTALIALLGGCFPALARGSINSLLE